MSSFPSWFSPTPRQTPQNVSPRFVPNALAFAALTPSNATRACRSSVFAAWYAFSTDG